MKKATVRELRNRFGQIAAWLDAGETVQVIKRGRPYARVVPENRPRTFVNACPGNRPLPADLDAPVDVEWEADR